MSKRQIETSCSYTDETMWVSTDEKWLINRILRLSVKYPGQVEVIAGPEDNDGCLYCKIPSNWLHIRPPVKRELSDERRVELAQRMKKHSKIP